MAYLNTNTRIGTLALFRPDSIKQMSALGIDLALEADRSVEEACAMRNVEARFFLLDILDDDREGAPGLDWSVVRPSKGEWEPGIFLSF